MQSTATHEGTRQADMAPDIRWRGALSPDRPSDQHVNPKAWRPGTPLVPPRSITDSVRLLQFGAILNVLEILRGILTRGALRTAIIGEAQKQGVHPTPDAIDRATAVVLGVTTVVAAISAVVWYLLSRATARGSKWARIIATVLFALAVIGFLGGALPTAGLFHLVFALALLLIGAWSLVRLWHRDSSAWITYQATAQD